MGALEKFIVRKPQVSVDEEIGNTQQDNAKGNNREEYVNVVVVDDRQYSEKENAHDVGFDAEHNENNEDSDLESNDRGNVNELVNEEPSQLISMDIFHPKNWDNLDPKFRDLLLEKGPKRDFLTGGKGPKDHIQRRFSSKYYTRHLSNGEKQDRDWLVYSKDLDRVFCFCCKLFKKSQHHSLLACEGYKDWIHLSSRLKEHEKSLDHVTHMSYWIEFRLRLEKNKTIDAVVQDHIKKEKEYWRNLLRRLISIVKYLAKYSLAFRGTNERVQDHDINNGNFLGQIEMLAGHTLSHIR